MTTYIILFAICFISAIVYDNYNCKDNYHYRKIFFLIIFLSCSLVQGLRYDVGSDYLGTYTAHYKFAENGVILNSDIEIGFKLLYNLLANLNLGVESFFFITSFWINYFFIKTIFERNSKISLSIFIYFFGTLFFFSMTAIRQVLAMGIIFYALKYVENNDWKKYFISCLVACLFHLSVIIFLPLYFILNKKISNRTILLSIMILFITMSSLIPIITNIIMETSYSKYYSSYSEEYATEKIGFTGIIQIVIFIVFFVFGNDLKDKDKTFNIYYNFTFLGAVATALSIYFPAGYRIISLFKYIEILTVPYFLSKTNRLEMKPNKYSRENFLLRCFFIAIYLIYFGYSIVYKNYNDCIPYKTIFHNIS